MPVQLDGQRLARELAPRDVRQHALGVDVDGVSAGRLDNRDAGVGDVPPEVFGRYDPVAQVVRVENFGKTHRNGLQIAARQAAVGGEPLGENEQVLLLLGQPVVVGAEQPADVGERVFLGGEGAAVGQREHLLSYLLGRPVRVSRLALPDEPGVLGEPASVQIERNTMPGSGELHLLDVRERDRLSSAGIVGHREHDQRDAGGALRLDEPLEGGHVHVALERQPRLGVGGLGARKVGRARAAKLDVGAGGIEVRVIGNGLAGPAHHREEDTLGGPPLVGRNHVAKPGQVLDRPLQPVETLAAGVGFVAAHHGRPLLGGHGAGARIRQQVDEDVPGVDQEKVVPRLFQEPLALLARGLPQRLHALDAEWLDYRFHNRECSRKETGRHLAGKRRARHRSVTVKSCVSDRFCSS